MVSRDIDPIAVAHHLTYLWCPVPRTMLAGVKKLEPGMAMYLREGKVVRHWRFYDLPYGREQAALSESSAVELVRERVEQAVGRQMVADVPVGAFLSDGLDSSAVAALARQHTKERLQCFNHGARWGWGRRRGHGGRWLGGRSDPAYLFRVVVFWFLEPLAYVFYRLRC